MTRGRLGSAGDEGSGGTPSTAERHSASAREAAEAPVLLAVNAERGARGEPPAPKLTVPLLKARRDLPHCSWDMCLRVALPVHQTRMLPKLTGAAAQGALGFIALQQEMHARAAAACLSVHTCLPAVAG
jgi:hypothetical protein